MGKKILKFFMAFAIILAPISFVAIDDASAKGYKSGKRSYSPSKSQPVFPKKDTNNQSSKVKQDENKTVKNNTAAQKPNKGGMLKGLLLGGLGGLLIGSLFAGMGLGGFGSILAFIVNILVIVGIIMLIRNIFIYFKNSRKQKAENEWRR
ncbi:putative lipid-binding transport protein (Tim44 family) [Oikeobacillus pervagus]|uniref:Lipid-binding transport protein (Tim44 family) n=1 Tax=Oikeobacillus pervagus TaxID=1325931 RepID=A0AAJ1T733_9BACI|nr:hypothetical protein [Oikeobacillus pervagus]MDQ0216351.1 putative lipid-binding transport protein (Tim44 family) [Oikeobacillus pervagus]